MLVRYFRRLVLKIGRFGHRLENHADKLQTATALLRNGDSHAAVGAFLTYLDHDPYNVQALNDLGACLADIGNKEQASAIFDRAYALDDTYLPVVVNHAKLLNDRRRSAEAMPFIRQAKIRDADYAHVDSVYASIQLSLGDAKRAAQFQLRAWLSNFDNLRFANSHLFYSAYVDMDEKRLAAEHSFWAETLKPVENPWPAGSSSSVEGVSQLPKKDGRIRIGYWSPDFRNHSVRFFFRPLLENHDASKFDVVLYHDFPGDDEQTALIYMEAPHSHKVSDFSDADLYALIRSHELDVLVELAGHSSHNRVSLLQHRLAPVQISALGYPPTTGLRSVDAKLMDRHIVTPQSSSYYAENPLVLPTSFWCFDPMEAAPIAPEPPLTANGFVTFACVGNVAKINPRMLHCWKEILDAVPDSRLLLRSISFEDDAAIAAMATHLQEAGIEEARVSCHKPAAGAAYYSSYNEVDIVLDTFPFNGGTTTCFATYMGVPVVSLVGESLISRMGLSMLVNLGLDDLAVDSEAAYVRRAIALAQDHDAVRRFKREARQRFTQTSLGNGLMFAQEFEAACAQLLAHKKTGAVNDLPAIAPLPADELVRRAYGVMRTGQTDAAQRVLNYCLRHYPDCGGAHLLISQQMAEKGQSAEANAYLQARLANFTPSEQVGALISIARQYLQLGERSRFEETVASLGQCALDDALDELQVRLFQAQCSKRVAQSTNPTVAVVNATRITILIPCDDATHFALMQEKIRAVCAIPAGCSLRVQRCDERLRANSYRKELQVHAADVLILLQKNIEIFNTAFLSAVLTALRDYDLVGFAGAMRWSRMDWRKDGFMHKAAGYVQHPGEGGGLSELQWLGTTRDAWIPGAAVLDGSLMAINVSTASTVAMDDDLEDAGLLMEECWSHEFFRAGQRVGIHCNLGVLVHPNAHFYAPNLSAGLMKMADQYGFDPFTELAADSLFLSTPVIDTDEATAVMANFLSSVECVSAAIN